MRPVFLICPDSLPVPRFAMLEVMQSRSQDRSGGDAGHETTQASHYRHGRPRTASPTCVSAGSDAVGERAATIYDVIPRAVRWAVHEGGHIGRSHGVKFRIDR